MAEKLRQYNPNDEFKIREPQWVYSLAPTPRYHSASLSGCFIGSITLKVTSLPLSMISLILIRIVGTSSDMRLANRVLIKPLSGHPTNNITVIKRLKNDGRE